MVRSRTNPRCPHQRSHGQHPQYANATIQTSDLRLSMRCRIWASSWCRSKGCRSWAEQLLESLCGLRQHAGVEEAAAFLQDTLVLSQGHLITLHYSACYDRMSAMASVEFLACIGFPKPLTAHILQACRHCLAMLSLRGALWHQSPWPVGCWLDSTQYAVILHG